MKSELTRLLFAAVLILAMYALPAWAEDVYILAMDYTAVSNTGGRPITVDSYGWLHGIDIEGEWLEFEFDLATFGEHSSTIHVKGEMDVPFHLRMEITGNSSHFMEVLDFNFTGSGFVG